jgi:hypothetical protein
MQIPHGARYPMIIIAEELEGWQTSLFYQLDDGTEHEETWPLRVNFQLAEKDAARTIGDRCGVVVRVRPRQQMAAE